MACKGICIRHKLPKPLPHFCCYVNGHKVCQKYDIFLDWKDGMWCLCCGGKLRMNSRNKESKDGLD
jgi:hypothetical protein